MQIPWLDPSLMFPDPNSASSEPDGLLAIGGDLSLDRLKAAYRQGIFPFYQTDPPESPVLWWSPAFRAVLFVGHLHISRSLKRQLRKKHFRVSMNLDFGGVIQGCASRPQTWITPKMRAAYTALHRQGLAHSIEVWEDAHLVGGLYGVSLGRIFFAESMFSRRANASKIAMVYLQGELKRRGYPIVDCQLQNPHLERMGVTEIPRKNFLNILQGHVDAAGPSEPWFDPRLELELSA